MPPYFFEKSMFSSSKENTNWTKYWENYGIKASIKKGLILQNKNELNDIKSLFEEKVIGIVVNFIDKTIHGETLGTWGVHQAVKKWLETGFFIDLLESLISNRYEVYITSDHGNIEAEGIGDLGEGCLSISRGARVRIYNNKILAEKALERFPQSIITPKAETESTLYYLYAPDRKAFSDDRIVKVTHGGLSIEEVIIPFVRVVRKI